MMLSAQEIYQTQVLNLPLTERLRLAALLLNALQSSLSSADNPFENNSLPPPPRPKRGSGKHDILFMADDFDAPLEDLRGYSVGPCT